MSHALQGRRILLTRPDGQVETLAGQLRTRGAQVSHFPALRIVLTAPDKRKRNFLAAADLVIFVSVNAVRGLLAAPGGFLQATQAARGIAAIGPATADALAEAGLAPALTAPAPYNSETLLATEPLQTTGLKIVIVRGQSGRERLADTLRQRGMEVVYLDVYRRETPEAVLSLRTMSGGPPEAIGITSVEIAENLLACVAPDEREDLLRCPLVAGNERIANACQKLGYTAIGKVAENPGDAAMLDALRRCLATP